MARFFLLYILIILAAGFAQELTAQAYDFRSLTVSEGLPHGQVRDIHQTKDGYIWIGTVASGLVRYDGHHFESLNQSNGLKDDSVHIIYESRNETLWVATYEGGVSVLDENAFINPFSGSAIDTLYVTSVTEAPSGDTWFSTIGGGVFIFDGDQLHQITKTDGLIGDEVWDVHWGDDETSWIATTKGLSVYQDGEFRNFNQDHGISGERIFRITDRDGIKWLATSRGVTTYDGESFAAITEINGRPLHYVYDILTDSNGTVWIGMENDGVFWYDGEEFTHISRTEGLVSNRVYKMFDDHNGNVWVGTDERGISIYKGDQFRFYNTGNGLNSNEVYSIIRDDLDRMWIGTEEGLQSYKDNQFQMHDLPDRYTREKQVWFIEQLPNGNLIILLNDNLAWEYNDGIWENYSEKIGLTDEWIYDLMVDSSGTLWISTDSGVLLYKDSTLKRFDTSDGLPGMVVYHAFESNNGDIWLAANGGAARYDGKQFHSYTTKEGLAHYNVNLIAQDQFGDIWLGTSAGVSHLQYTDSNSVKITNFGKEQGMKLVESLSLWFDGNDQLWQGTNGGIHQLDVAQYRKTGVMNIRHHPLSDHGIGVETMHKALQTDSAGQAWFGTMDGILILNNQIADNDRKAPVTYIHDLRLNGSDIDWNTAVTQEDTTRARSALPSLEIPYGIQALTFIFTGLDYLNPDNIQYRYKLDGFDEDWSRPTDQNSATYTNLPSGSYKFLVQSRSESGSWSENAAIYNFSIDAPFWMSAWFWVLMLSVAGFAFYGFTAVKLNRLEREKLSQLVDEKTHHLQEALDEKVVLLKEIHHRVKNNLAVIYSLLDLQSGYLEDEKTQVIFDDSKMRVRSIALVHEKLYQNDNLSKIEARNYIPDLVEVIADAHLTPDKTIQLNLDIDNVELSLDQGIPCGLILNELISNTYKHAFSEQSSGDVNVDLKEIDGYIDLQISDNGKGLPEDFVIGNSNSLGLILVRTLCDQIKADLDISNTNPGTKFKVRFKKEVLETQKDLPLYK